MTADTDFSPVVIQCIATTARQCVWAGHGPVLIENRDIATTAYLGSDEGMDPGGNDTAPLDPLGSKSFDGTRDVWCRSETGSALLVSLPGGVTSQVSPILIAEQLSTSGLALNSSVNNPAYGAFTHVDGVTTGVPSTHGYDVLQAPGSFTSVAGGTSASFTYAMHRPGYLIQVTAGGAASDLVYQVTMLWQDSATGATVCEEIWYATANATTSAVVFGKGPVKGNQLTVTFKNYDPVNALSLFWAVEETTQHIARDDWRGTASVATQGLFGVGAGDPLALIGLAELAQAVAASASLRWALPLYSGQAYVEVSMSGPVAGSVGTVYALHPVLGQVPIWEASLAALNNGPYTITLPRCPCGFLFLNGGGAAQTVNVGITYQEYAS